MKAKPSSEPPGEARASVRELKARFSHYLRLAKAGKKVEITERGTPIGRIVPTSGALAERIESLARSGLLVWNGRKLRSRAPVARVKTRKTVAQILVEQRQ
jgi:prevent-host-death family protein